MNATAGLGLCQREVGGDEEKEEEHPVRLTSDNVVLGRNFTSSVSRGGVLWGGMDGGVEVCCTNMIY